MIQSSRRRFRPLHVVLAVLAVLVAAVIVSDLLGWRFLRRPLESIGSNALKRPVTIAEPFRLHLLRPSIDVAIGGLDIASPSWSTEPHFVAIKDAAANISWGFLVGRPLHINALSLGEGDIRALREKSGNASWSFDRPEKPDPHPKPFSLPTIDHIKVGSLHVKYVDEPLAASVNADLRTLEENGKESLVANGDGSWKRNPIGFAIRIPDVLRVAGEQSNAALDAKLHIKTTDVSFDGTIANVVGLDGIKGNVFVKGRSLGDLALVPGLTLPETPQFELKGSLEKNGKDIIVKVPTFDVGSSKMSADLEYQAGSQPPLLRGSLGASRLVLQDLGPAIGSQKGEARNRGDDKTGKANKLASAGKVDKSGKPDKGTLANDNTAGAPSKVLPAKEFDIPSLKVMNAQVAVDLRELDLGTDALRPLTAVSTQLSLRDGLLRLSDLKASLAGGSVAGETSYDSSNDRRQPTWESTLKWRRVDLAQWVKNQGRNLFVAGKFSGDTQVRGTGKSTAKILDTLDGTIKGRIDDGSLSQLIVEAAGFDIAQSLGVFVSSPKPLKLSCALIDLKSTQGQIQLNSILNTVDSFMFVDGGTDLGTEALDLRLVVAPKDWSPLTLRTPITVKGTYGSPSIGVDKKPLALKVIAATVLGVVAAPLAAIVPLIDLGSGDGGDGCEAAIKAARDRSPQTPASPASATQQRTAPAGQATAKSPIGSAR